MSRLALIVALVGSLATTGHAERAPAGEAQRVTSVGSYMDEQAPPPGGRAEMDRAALRTALAARREANLAIFHAYQETGVFPNNVYKARQLNVWRDDNGHLCAAANIINLSGATALVDQIAEKSNFIKLGDVKGGPLMDWMMTSGFTQTEIAAIQKPYSPVTLRPAIKPDHPIAIDQGMRDRENARLLKVYRNVEKQLRANTDKNLDAAVDTLMQHPRLAATIL